jgi:hypothetical protein
LNEQKKTGASVEKIVGPGGIHLRVTVPGEPTEWQKFNKQIAADIAMKHVESRIELERPHPTMTVNEFADLWIEDHLLKVCSPKTCNSYRSALNSYILLHFDRVLLARVDQAMIRQFIASHRGKVSEQRLMKIVETLSSMLSCAVRWHYLKNNPAGRIFSK